MLQREVSTKPSAGRTHRGDVEIVECAVDRPPRAHRWIQIGGDFLALQRWLFSVVEILFAQVVADVDQFRHREHSRTFMPWAPQQVRQPL